MRILQQYNEILTGKTQKKQILKNEIDEVRKKLRYSNENISFEEKYIFLQNELKQVEKEIFLTQFNRSNFLKRELIKELFLFGLIPADIFTNEGKFHKTLSKKHPEIISFFEENSIYPKQYRKNHLFEVRSNLLYQSITIQLFEYPYNEDPNPIQFKHVSDMLKANYTTEKDITLEHYDSMLKLLDSTKNDFKKFEEKKKKKLSKVGIPFLCNCELFSNSCEYVYFYEIKH